MTKDNVYIVYDVIVNNQGYVYYKLGWKKGIKVKPILNFCLLCRPELVQQVILESPEYKLCRRLLKTCVPYMESYFGICINVAGLSQQLLGDLTSTLTDKFFLPNKPLSYPDISSLKLNMIAY